MVSHAHNSLTKDLNTLQISFHDRYKNERRKMWVLKGPVILGCHLGFYFPEQPPCPGTDHTYAQHAFHGTAMWVCEGLAGSVQTYRGQVYQLKRKSRIKDQSQAPLSNKTLTALYILSLSAISFALKQSPIQTFKRLTQSTEQPWHFLCDPT